jgi:hydrogenase maturation factor
MDCIGSCKSNYHTITAMMVHQLSVLCNRTNIIHIPGNILCVTKIKYIETDRYDITEILLKVPLNTIILTHNPYFENALHVTTTCSSYTEQVCKEWSLMAHCMWIFSVHQLSVLCNRTNIIHIPGNILCVTKIKYIEHSLPQLCLYLRKKMANQMCPIYGWLELWCLTLLSTIFQWSGRDAQHYVIEFVSDLRQVVVFSGFLHQ